MGNLSKTYETCICGELVLSSEFGGLCSEECMNKTIEFLFEYLMGASAKEIYSIGEDVNDPKLKKLIDDVAEADIIEKGGSYLG